MILSQATKPEDLEVKIGYSFEDPWGTEMVCVGYQFSDRPGLGLPFNSHRVSWSDSENCFVMPHPTDSGSVAVPFGVKLQPVFVSRDEAEYCPE